MAVGIRKGELVLRGEGLLGHERSGDFLTVVTFREHKSQETFHIVSPPLMFTMSIIHCYTTWRWQ